MNILNKALFRDRLSYFIFYSILAAGIMSPIAADSYIPGLADYINHLSAIIQAKMALLEGQFPLRIAPLEQEGWRYPYFQFYSPTTYTLAGLIYLVLTPHNPLIAYKITIWCGLMAGGFYMNRLAYWFVKSKPAAFLASITYLMSPYYIVVVNNFCDLSEILSLGIVPAAFYYVFQRYYHPSNINLLQTGLVWYLLITTHAVTFVYSLFGIVLVLTFLTLRNKNHWGNLIRVGIGIGFGVMLAMWYLGPVFIFGKYVLVSQTFLQSTTFDTFAPVISQLLSPGATRFKNELHYNHAALGWTILLSAGLCTYAVLQKQKINNKRANYWLPALLVVFYLTFFMAWSPINFWQWLPAFMRIGQYSWRLLGLLSGIGSLLFAWAICFLFKNKLDLRHVIIGIICIIVLSTQWFPSINNSQIDINKFKKHPYFYYNQNAYALNFNKNTEYVDYIDTMILYSLMAHDTLQMNFPYFIPKSLLNIGTNPSIVINGQIKNQSLEPNKIQCFVNDKIIATKILKPGVFNWEIPLRQLPNQFQDATQFKVIFKTDKKIKIPVKKVALTGFLDPNKTIRLENLGHACTQQGTRTQCTLSITNNIDLVELPILYYPKLLNISINGHKTPYQSIVHMDSLLTGIKPKEGLNKIDIQFKGLTWGNWISRLSWSLWVFLLITSLISYRKTSKK